ncbi:hypothetical protein J8273_7104 [Carpediemonas membranifera]|uniref:Uncharacterized protein n=1 Tax=Carpediemonas membranifera TaxID=201153 RepID=A0A8J6AS08_9EUKA|nr:hypothetical protein J8273_7104 [Carpediemonas membranifera]|eukprot:KAG9390845.1 hypothetical protein J8273_7104 [Carpediemonas membranifera]
MFQSPRRCGKIVYFSTFIQLGVRLLSPNNTAASAFQNTHDICLVLSHIMQGTIIPRLFKMEITNVDTNKLTVVEMKDRFLVADGDDKVIAEILNNANRWCLDFQVADFV